ncbi:MAG TPA: aldo/keto reductase family protein [Acidisarcina sp.]
MQKRRLGNSELYVSEIALGSWLTFAGGIARDESERCIRAAIDLGMNFFDTANEYGRGAAETLLGDVLSTYPRDSYILGTKLFFPMSDEPGSRDRGLSAAQIVKQLDASLRRLRTDYVDLYQCHRFDVDTPLEETMGALTRAVESGKVRAIGFSEWTADQIKQAVSWTAEGPYKPFASSQPQYSMLWRKPESDIFPLCARYGISQIVFSPLAQGVLTGKYQPGQPPPTASRAASNAMNMFLESKGRRFRSDDLLAAVQRLVPIAKELGMSLSQMALAWVLRREEVTAAIIGASRPEQLEENVKASAMRLSREILTRIDDAIGGVAVAG